MEAPHIPILAPHHAIQKATFSIKNSDIVRAPAIDFLPSYPFVRPEISAIWSSVRLSVQKILFNVDTKNALIAFVR